MRVLPIIMAAAIGMSATAALAQTGAGSNQPPGQPTTTESARQKMDDTKMAPKTKKMTKKHSKKMKKEM